MAIHNGQNLHALATAGWADALAPTLCRRKGRIDEALALVEVALLTQRIRQLRQDLAQDFALAPLLEPAMHRLVVGVALRQQVPLGPGVQNPQDRFQDPTRGDGLAAWAAVRNVF